MPRLLNRGIHHEVLATGTTLFRVHRSDRKPLWYGPAPGEPPECRFDAPSGEYRTFYAGLSITAAFAESVLHRPTGQVVKREALFTRSWSQIHANRELRLAQFRGPGILKHGLSSAIITGDYDVTQALALEVFGTSTEADGIIFRSSHDDDHFNVALFDRVTADDLTILSTTTFSQWGQDNWLPLLTQHGAILEPENPIPEDTDAVLLMERDRPNPATAKRPRLE